MRTKTMDTMLNVQTLPVASTEVCFDIIPDIRGICVHWRLMIYAERDTSPSLPRPSLEKDVNISLQYC